MSDVSTTHIDQSGSGVILWLKEWLRKAKADGLHPNLMRRHWVLWALIMGFLAIQIPMFIFGPFGFDRENGHFLLILLGICFASSSLILLRYRDPITGHLISGFALLTTLSIGGAGLSYFCAAINMPLQDSLFMTMDRAIGFDWMSHMRWLTADASRISIAIFAYTSLSPQCFLIIPAMIFARRFHAVQIFLGSWLLAIIVTLVVFAVLPGVSIFQHLDILEEMKTLLPRSGGFTHATDLEAARAHLPIAIYASPEGIIPFPSFHACGGVLLLWAFWQVPYLRWPMAILNLLMIAATPVIGSHYLVDVIAGVGIAILAIHIVKRLMPEPDA